MSRVRIVDYVGPGGLSLNAGKSKHAGPCG